MAPSVFFGFSVACDRAFLASSVVVLPFLHQVPLSLLSPICGLPLTPEGEAFFLHGLLSCLLRKLSAAASLWTFSHGILLTFLPPL